MITSMFTNGLPQMTARLAARVSLVASLFIGAILSTAHAAVVLQVNGSGILTGATGVIVGASSYDVQFVDGTCIGLFSGCDAASDFAFSSSAGASLASQALLDQVFLDGSGLFDSAPGLTAGCALTLPCGVITPFNPLTSLTVDVFLTVNQSPPFTDLSLPAAIGTAVDTSTLGSRVFARWTLSPPTTIPEPATLPAIGLGLFAAMLALRRRT